VEGREAGSYRGRGKKGRGKWERGGVQDEIEYMN